MQMVKDITRALVEHTENGGTFKTPEFKNFELGKNQVVRIEDLL